jgi:putative membrane protein
MNVKIKKFISLMLIPIIAFSFSSTVFAQQEGIIKEEIVYVMLNENGTPKTVYVVNSYNNHTGGQLTDYGQYETVRNLSTLDNLKNEKSMVTANIPKGKFYYEGKLSKAEIPWHIDIIYKLDGKTKTTTELAGKHGKLEILINVSQNQNFGSEFYENYALQVSTSMDTNKCNSIIAQGATITNIGENKNISFTMMPKKGGLYKINADVTNFEMGAISMGGVPFSMDLKLDGISDMTTGLSELTDGITKLDTGAQEVQKGSKELKDGMNKLSNESENLVSGSSAILNAISQINNVLSSLEGLTAPTGGIAKLKMGSEQYQAEINELASRCQLLPKSSQAINNGIKNSSNALSSIATEDKAMETLISNLSLMKDPNVNILIKAYNSKMEAVKSVSSGFSILSSQYSDFDKGIYDIAEATQSLSKGYTQIQKGIENINVVMNDLAILTAAINTLKVQYQKLNNGIIQYTDGYKKLVSGYSSIYSGISIISSGTFELHDKTKTLDTDVSDEIENILNGFSNSDFEPISFTSKKNTSISAVQFVMKTDAIAIETQEVVINEKPEKLSFWEKFLALF